MPRYSFVIILWQLYFAFLDPLGPCVHALYLKGEHSSLCPQWSMYSYQGYNVCAMLDIWSI